MGGRSWAKRVSQHTERMGRRSIGWGRCEIKSRNDKQRGQTLACRAGATNHQQGEKESELGRERDKGERNRIIKRTRSRHRPATTWRGTTEGHRAKGFQYIPSSGARGSKCRCEEAPTTTKASASGWKKALFSMAPCAGRVQIAGRGLPKNSHLLSLAKSQFLHPGSITLQSS